ncbi:hypothetical protein, variant 2 [Verruconis gallopava]|uniref:Flavin-nucleotide-binding protein n=1 Tax=Verruconis gallopava TaxID=253628 RepID=A0A0D2AIJ9_9PEZI|nr:uncharacterized protein PV09_02413 [Verruconis gallopava]XP_016216586.1 hypothetical protein, variant 1 [Verruconis gallopava]XP_016216587.1 hypothetical protein, variant 2 [Verruconis gallopava]KIW06716.1 hypothetical protein PV09_02413 [Verruconis gallopava]KIW06717.1 hypothetical protein, variant 1 [Verruconis gallopava]KIW06718.1 hypothetical protein, variant 2 [Verruconis gallopava]
MENAGYERDARSTVVRLKERGQYDYATIHRLIDTTAVLHVSFPPSGDDPFPAILPMLGCTGVFDPDGKKPEPHAAAPGSFPEDEDEEDYSTGPRCIYLHGHAASRLFKAPLPDRLPVCVAATTMQGVVLALTPFHNSCNYASAVVHGYASVVTNEAERMYALTRITDNLVAHRWDNSRNPPTKAEMTTTGVLRIDIVSASAKVRVGGPGDDRHDMKNESVINNVWTGVVPTYTVYGEPIPSDYNRVGKVPSYMKHWIERENMRSKEEALSAVAKDKK